MPVYEEVLREGDLGLHFQVGDVGVLAEQLERIVRDDGLRAELAARGSAAREELSWSRVTDHVEAIYERLAALRHDPDPKPEIRTRLAKRKLIDVDLHMHTDHSQRLRDAGGRAAGDRRATSAWARSRSPTTTRSPARSTRARRPRSTASR